MCDIKAGNLATITKDPAATAGFGPGARLPLASFLLPYANASLPPLTTTAAPPTPTPTPFPAS